MRSGYLSKEGAPAGQKAGLKNAGKIRWNEKTRIWWYLGGMEEDD